MVSVVLWALRARLPAQAQSAEAVEVHRITPSTDVRPIPVELIPPVAELVGHFALTVTVLTPLDAVAIRAVIRAQVLHAAIPTTATVSSCSCMFWRQRKCRCSK